MKNSIKYLILSFIAIVVLFLFIVTKLSESFLFVNLIYPSLSFAFFAVLLFGLFWTGHFKSNIFNILLFLSVTIIMETLFPLHILILRYFWIIIPLAILIIYIYRKRFSSLPKKIITSPEKTIDGTRVGTGIIFSLFIFFGWLAVSLPFTFFAFNSDGTISFIFPMLFLFTNNIILLKSKNKGFKKGLLFGNLLVLLYLLLMF